MALPALYPSATTSSIVLPSSALPSEVTGLPFSVYANDPYFQSGAAEQVSYVYHKLGGDVLDVELTKAQVFTAYQESCLEYSNIINMHQAKNVIYQLLGATTGTFDQNGQIQSGTALYGADVALKFPKFSFAMAKKIARTVATEYGLGGDTPIYSASFTTIDQQQDYDLQAIVSGSSALSSSVPFYQMVGDKRITVTRVYYKTPFATWRFYGYYGGVSLLGNASSYGQWKDDSTFEVIPVWQNKLQAINYQDSLRVRTSHYSFEIKNNKLRLFPVPQNGYNPQHMWFEFFIEDMEPWTNSSGSTNPNTNGVNNMNTLPFENIPYQNINSIGKNWIKSYCVALCKEMLGLIRSKYASLPIPGDSVTLNGPQLITDARESQKTLKEDLQKILDDMTADKITEREAKLLKENAEILSQVPHRIWVG